VSGATARAQGAAPSPIIKCLGKRQFGVSSHLYRGQRLRRDHLLEIAAHGFDVFELAAVSGHFDAGNPTAVADLQQWLAEARLDLAGVEAGPDPADAEQALLIARRIPVKVLVVPVGPRREASRLIDRLTEAAAPLDVTIAVDSRSPAMTPIGSLVHFVEHAPTRIGIALDFATAGTGGALVDAIETASEHLLAVRVPLEGSIDWALAMTTIQKVGYEGAFIFDSAAPGPSTREMLARGRAIREQMTRWLTSI
jgi:sugar phosphate isomerase/epimerase